MGVSDYIMSFKSMMFLVPNQRHFKLVFDSSYSYLLYSCNKSIVRFGLNYCFGGCGYSGPKGMRELYVFFRVFPNSGIKSYSMIFHIKKD